MRKVSGMKGRGQRAVTQFRSLGGEKRSAGCKLPSGSFEKEMWKSKFRADGTKFKSPAQASVVRTPGIRMLNRYGEVWFVVKDISILLGRKTDRFTSWQSIPEMERDVDWFDRVEGRKQCLKIVTLTGLPVLLKSVSPALRERFLEWAQAVTMTAHQNGAGERITLTAPDPI